MGDREVEAVTLYDLESLFQEAQPDLAVVFGKQAVNVLQGLRRDNRGLEDLLRRSYEKSVESVYRDLADLLIQRGRFGEAEEVLNLLKDKEAGDFIRRDSVSDELRSVSVKLRDYEKEALDRYDQIVDQIAGFGQKKLALDAKSSRTSAESQESIRLSADISKTNLVLNRYFEELAKAPAFSAKSSLDPRLREIKDAVGLQESLEVLGPDVVAIYTLVMPDKYVAMLVTSRIRKAYTFPIKEKDLNKKIEDFRQQLQEATSDPLPLAQELYRIVFPEGLRKDLDGMHAKTIMWSVDSTLRYIPYSTLHDGKQYLVQSFQQSLFTPDLLKHITDPSQTQWTGAGFGVSEGKDPLPSVAEELRSIFKETPDSQAPVPGVVRLNAAFTRVNFESDLSQRRPVVHIATHFDSQPGGAAESALLLGDGERLSLDEIDAAEPPLFDGVDLLTLSACNTAFKNGYQDGREVDSFGTIAYRQGAKAVIASLWSVNDPSTASLMETMYRLRQQGGMPKGEALRQAQVAMLAGQLKPKNSPPEADRGAAIPNRADGPVKARGDWSHPYYWAPFILLGNWR